jgi:hypothetical protein
MPTDLMGASAPPDTANSNVRNVNVVAIALTAALVTLQLVGLTMLERSHAYAMHPSVPLEPAVCTESAEVPVSQISYD